MHGTPSLFFWPHCTQSSVPVWNISWHNWKRFHAHSLILIYHIDRNIKWSISSSSYKKNWRLPYSCACGWTCSVQLFSWKLKTVNRVHFIYGWKWCVCVCISDFWSFYTSILVVETECVLKVVFCSTNMHLINWENFSAFFHSVGAGRFGTQSISLWYLSVTCEVSSKLVWAPASWY